MGKWKKEHISLIVFVIITWIILLIPLKFQGVDIFVIGTFSGLLAVLFYVIFYNDMMKYVENNAYKKIENK